MAIMEQSSTRVGVFSIFLITFAVGCHSRILPQQHPQSAPPVSAARGLQANCSLLWFDQTKDHFSFLQSDTYRQRYYVCSQYWNNHTGPIFFYTGNEGDVLLYLDHMGLMWENAASFGALLVFAEHRFYGESLLDDSDMHLLTHEQALADYVTLLHYIKEESVYECQSCPVIAFGGSYGGMLSAFIRLKYPGSVDGSISGSAPILAFPGQTPQYDTQTYWAVVTRDATSAGGSASACASNVRAAWPVLFEQGHTEDGRARLSSVFRLCDPLTSSEDVQRLALLLYFAFDSMAMGDYPYPCNYMTANGPNLVAWPMRVACEFLSDETLPSRPWDLLAAMNSAASVFNNATNTSKCFTLPTDVEDDGIWDYQWCTELLPQESYFTTDGVNDMFWPRPYNWTFIQDRCTSKWGVTPRKDWIYTEYGDSASIAKYGSNIFFSNGEYDPWSSAGVRASLSTTLPAAIVEMGGHHLDLFFANPADPPSVRDVRQMELKYISEWLSQAKKQ